MARKISQSEARRLRRRVEELETEKRSAFYGSAVGLIQVDLSDWGQGMLGGPVKLGHRLVAKLSDDGTKVVISALR